MRVSVVVRKGGVVMVMMKGGDEEKDRGQRQAVADGNGCGAEGWVLVVGETVYIGEGRQDRQALQQ